jgi:hypothetical protein
LLAAFSERSATGRTSMASNLETTKKGYELFKQGDISTGKIIKEDWVHIFKYNQGRMVFFQEYTDTAAVVLGMS